MDCSPPGSSVHEILQVRILEWVAISFSRGSSWPRDRTHVSCIGRKILYHGAARKAQSTVVQYLYFLSVHLMPASVCQWLYFLRYCTARLKCFFFNFCVFLMYYLYEKYSKPITVWHYIANCASWVPRLTLLDLTNKLDLRTCSQNGIRLYVGDLL